MARSSASPAAPSHYIVDGSNIATEGRAMPSLKQLNEAVLAFIEEHPDALITVVVDATFGHRIEKSEVDDFDQAVANNELVTPPAGAVGRGDAFVLTIAHKAKAGILSNDSFQEFHGDYPWLFDAGRLIGGKPVPHVGWVFVERLPVRGPRSRQSVKEAKQNGKGKPTASRASRGSGSPLADQPLPVPTAPPPGLAAVAKSKRVAAPGSEPHADPATVAAVASAAPATKTVNELMPFLEFVEKHPVGTSCTVVVESYASHGAYARAGDVLVYLPLRLMGNPVPRSARSAVTIGEALAVVIAGYTPERRSVDAALPSAAEGLIAPVAPAVPSTSTATRGRKKAAAAPPEPVLETAVAPAETSPPEAPPAKAPRKRAAKKAAASAAETTETQAVVEPEKPAKPATPAKPAKPASRRTKKSAATAAPSAQPVVEAEPPAPTPPSEPTPARAPVKKAAKRASKKAAAPAALAAPAAASPEEPQLPGTETAGEPASPAPGRTKRASKKAPAAAPAAELTSTALADEAPKPAKKAAARARAAKKASS